MKKVLIASATLAAIGLAAPAVLAADRGIIAPAPAYTPPPTWAAMLATDGDTIHSLTPSCQ